MQENSSISVTDPEGYINFRDLAERATELYRTNRPEVFSIMGSGGAEKCVQDTVYHLTYLSESVRSGSYTVFHSYLGWLKTLLGGLKVPESCLHDSLTFLRTVLEDAPGTTDSPAAGMRKYLDRAITELSDLSEYIPGVTIENHEMNEDARLYLTDLLAGRRKDASHLILELIRTGRSIRDIYLSVFQASQREIGRLWQLNRLTVAQEHYCTAATQLIMSQLYPQVFAEGAKRRTGKVFVGACVPGELHELGIRIVTDFFEMDGWDTHFLGANMPVASLAQFCFENKADFIGISVQVAAHLSVLGKTIKAIRSDPRLDQVQIIVGGHPFVADPELYRHFGADGTARSADHALEVADALGK